VRVYEVGVGAGGVDVYTKSLKLLTVIGQVSKLRWANEGKVAWIKEEDTPLALEIFV